MSTWTVQSASDGLGEWLVHACPGPEAWVIAPPGVALQSTSEIAGWRLGYWRETDRHSISLDADRPWRVRAISTREVLDLLPDEHHQFVLDTLLAQLATARKVALPLPGEAIIEDLARLGAQAAAWAQAELAEAFPHIGSPQLDMGAPFPLRPLTQPPGLLSTPAGPSAGGDRRPPQPPAQFIADWLRWLLERHLPAVYDAARQRRQRLRTRRGARACAAATRGHDGEQCRQSDTGEYALH